MRKYLPRKVSSVLMGLSVFWGEISPLRGELFPENSIQNALRPSELILPATSFYGDNQHAERIGYYISGAGDVNADFYDDFMVAAYHHDSHGWNSGGVYLFLGAKNKQWAVEESMSRADAIFKGSREYEMVGYNIAGKGDFNGDGYDDLLIGAPGTWETKAPNPGYLYIVLGRENTDWGNDFVLADGADISYRGELDDDQLGYAVNYVGDLNGDGCDEVICSAAFKSIRGDTWTGKVYLIPGKRDGFARGIPVLSDAVASFVYPAFEGTLGFSVAGVGDVNGDSLPDFLMAAKGIGTSFLMFGRPEMDWGFDFNLTNAEVIFTPENRRDQGGWQVKGLGDVNGDGLADFGVTGVELHFNFGKIYLILGREVWPREFSFRQADASYIGESSRDDAGMSIDGVGDFDGDGLDDFIFGARYYSRDWPHAGKEYFIRGKKTGWQRDLDLSLVPDYYTIEDSIYCLGWGSAGIGDYNGDSRPDFIASAPFNSNHGLHWNGRIYLFLGSYPLYHISGNVHYGDSQQSVKNISMTLTGERDDSLLTDEKGYFEFPLKPNSGYHLMPSKPTGEDVGDCISAFDAALVARHALGLENMVEFAQTAADVNLDGSVSLFDAALVLREAVNLPALPGSQARVWIFNPAFYNYQPISGSRANQNFTAVVRGDVDLDWQTNPAGFGKNSSKYVTFPDKIQAPEDDKLLVPVTLPVSVKILALDLSMSFNSAEIEFEGIRRTPVLANWTEAMNAEAGQVQISLYGTEWIETEGLILTLEFRVKSPPQSAVCIEKFKLNNLPAFTTQIDLDPADSRLLPQTFQMQQNYPNPFSGSTAIRFDLPRSEFVSLQIFNLLGQEVYRSENLPYPAGSHSVTWTGRNLQNQLLPGGIYYYIITAGDFRQAKKLTRLP